MGFMFYIWLMIMIIAIIVEIATTDLTSLWFAAGALAALVSSIFFKNEYIWIQVSIFGVVSIVFILILRPLIKKRIDSPTVATNVDALIGKTVIVTSPISPNFPGTVKAEGIEWTAENDIESFEPGDLVEIESIKGNTLHVIKTK